MQMRIGRALVVGAVLGSLTLGGVAQAAGVLHVPGTDGIIHACYKVDDGKLRLIDPQQDQCKRDEAPLQWNQTGPQGVKGDMGAQGIQGLKGDTGPQGPAGVNGAAGVSGYQQVVETNTAFTLASGTESVHTVNCPDGKKVLGGGFLLFGANGFLSNNSNGPVNDSQWGVAVYNPTPNTVTVSTVNFYAICATVS
jgi:hypothetical protein